MNGFVQMSSEGRRNSAAVVLCATVLGYLGYAGMVQAQAQTWPVKPIQIVVPFEPGGATDITGRMIGERLQKYLGQPGIVVYKTGAGTVIGTEYTVKSAPDGYTILLNTGTMVKTALLRQASKQPVPYDLQRDLAPIAIYYTQPELLMVHPSMAVNSVKELVAFAKANPGKLRYGSTGVGSVPHLTTEFISGITGITLTHVPYKGGGPAMTALVRGEIDMMSLGIQSVAPQVKAGKARAIAITSRERSPAFPDIATLSEQGLGDVDLQNWYALFAPARTPRTAIDRLFGALTQITSEPEFVEKLKSNGGTTVLIPGDRVRAIIDQDMKIWSKVIADSNIRAD